MKTTIRNIADIARAVCCHRREDNLFVYIAFFVCFVLFAR